MSGGSGALGRAFGLHLASCGVHTLVLSGRNEMFLPSTPRQRMS